MGITLSYLRESNVSASIKPAKSQSRVGLARFVIAFNKSCRGLRGVKGAKGREGGRMPTCALNLIEIFVATCYFALMHLSI